MQGVHIRDNLQPNETDWYGRYRMVESRGNDYLIDREEQRTKSFTGIDGIHTQDQAVTESMGGIVDRSWENLAPSDIAIARNRRMLLKTVQAFQNGVRPPSADDPHALCRCARRLLHHDRGRRLAGPAPGRGGQAPPPRSAGTGRRRRVKGRVSEAPPLHQRKS